MFKKANIIFVSLICLFINNILLAAVTVPLPPTLIALSSLAGDKLFNRSYLPEYFWPLNLQFVTQENLNYCSIASSIMALNALDITSPRDSTYVPFKIFTQDNFFTPDVEKILSSAMVKKQGATLEQIGGALSLFPVTVKIIYANTLTADQFRILAEKTIDQKKGYIIVNFLRTKLGENGVGHMSPLAAYDKKTDRFLILDVARYRYPSAWAKTSDLWSAMSTIDQDSHQYRGFVIVSKK